MRYVIVGLALIMLAGCGEGPATKAHNVYQACLAEKGVERCQTEKAQFDAAMRLADGQSRRMAAYGSARPPIVLDTYQPAQQPMPVYQPSRGAINCVTTGNVTSCN